MSNNYFENACRKIIEAFNYEPEETATDSYVKGTYINSNKGPEGVRLFISEGLACLFCKKTGEDLYRVELDREDPDKAFRSLASFLYTVGY